VAGGNLGGAGGDTRVIHPFPRPGVGDDGIGHRSRSGGAFKASPEFSFRQVAPG
jgi:hypothetical protein